MSAVLLGLALGTIGACLVDVARIWHNRPGVVRGADGVWRSSRAQWRRR